MKLKETIFSSDRCRGGEIEKKDTSLKEGKLNVASPSIRIMHFPLRLWVPGWPAMKQNLLGEATV